MIGTRATIRELFFDRQMVHNAIDEATRKVLSRFGAYTRRSAQQSIRSRKKASAPGKPPSSHTGLLKHNIFFAWDPQARSVVIGPTLLPKKVAGLSGSDTVPRLLEEGGTITKAIYRQGVKHLLGDYGTIAYGKRAKRERKRVRRVHGLTDFSGVAVVRTKLTTPAMVARADRLEEELAQLNLYQFGNAQSHTVTIGPRPFMVPAFQKELGVLDTLWQSAT